MELALQLEQVRALFVDIWPFRFQHLVQALALQAAARYGEVNKRNTRAQIGREFSGRVTRRQKYTERRRQVNVLIAECNKNSVGCVE